MIAKKALATSNIILLVLESLAANGLKGPQEKLKKQALAATVEESLIYLRWQMPLGHLNGRGSRGAQNCGENVAVNHKMDRTHQAVCADV